LQNLLHYCFNRLKILEVLSIQKVPFRPPKNVITSLV
jgi:hypothetical protein